MSEYEVEPIPGLPGLLPEGEELLWQGSPLWVPLAKRAFHVRAVLFYFGLLILLRVGFIIVDGEGLDLALQSALWLSFLALAATGILSLLGWLYARSTIYSITTRRVVIRSGVVVPMAVNLPFKSIESAGLRVYPDGSGDIPLALIPEQKVNYLIVWPNVRPWNFSKAQPMLRALGDVEQTAELLANALKAAVEADAQPEPESKEGVADTRQGGDSQRAERRESAPVGRSEAKSQQSPSQSTASSGDGAKSTADPLPSTPSP